MLIFWFVVGDDFDVTKKNFLDFPMNLEGIPENSTKALLKLVPTLEEAMNNNIQFKTNAGKNVGTYNLAMCRDVTDKSDAIFMNFLQLTNVWEDIELYIAQTVKTEFDS